MSGASNFAGTQHILHLIWQRDRLILPAWSIILGAMPPLYAASVHGLYKTAADLESFYASSNGNPSLVALYGPMFSPSVGSAGIWKAGPLLAFIAIASILTIIRHTRADEESGRSELLSATRLGRYAVLTAALCIACAGSALAGIVCGLGLWLVPLPAAGACAFGAAFAASGIVWAAIAGVAAQLSTSARTCRGAAMAALGTAFVVRGLGDARGDWLVWLSPLGWCLHIQAFAGDHWAVLAPLALATAAATSSAYILLQRRDQGSGQLPQRPGAQSAGRSLAGPFGLAARMQRGSLLAWLCGIGVYGALIGGVTNSIGDMIGSSESVRDAITRGSDSHSLQDAFLAVAFTMLGAFTAAYSISAALRLHDEESTGRAEPVLVGAVSRLRWAASHLAWSIAGPAIVLGVSGLLAGLIYGAAVHDVGGETAVVLGAAMVQLPAVWVLAGVTALLFGVLPRFATAAWAVFSVAVLIMMAGQLGSMPQWIADLSPFAHTPRIPGSPFHAAPLLWLTAAAIGLTVVGLAAFRRRDLHQ